MPPVTLESGHWVTPSLRLTEMLDEGAMGTVWLAEHARLDTQVVVKFVRENLANNETVRRRLAIEARAAARIRSPHVVRVFDFGLHEDTSPYIVMEHLVGQSLRERLDQVETLTLRETMLVVNHTCRALKEAHRLGIVHRDIKPANLFLLDDEMQGLFVKVLDFGVAKGMAQHITEPGGLIGTPAYLSPEQLRESSATHMCDLWALAAVAYECIVGDGPFYGETVDEVFARIWRCDVDPPSIANPQVSPELDAWFARALASQADLRPQTASEFASSFFDAALTCEEMLEATPEEWTSALWRLEVDGARTTAPLGSRPSAGRRERRVSSVELTAHAAPTRTLSGAAEANPRSTSHWSERPPESRPAEDHAPSSHDRRRTDAPEPPHDEHVPGPSEELADLAEPPPLMSRVPRLGLALVATLGLGLWLGSRQSAPPAPAAANPSASSRDPRPAPPPRQPSAGSPIAPPLASSASPPRPPTASPHATPESTDGTLSATPARSAAPRKAPGVQPAPARAKAPRPTTDGAAPSAGDGASDHAPAAQPQPASAPKPTQHGKQLGF